MFICKLAGIKCLVENFPFLFTFNDGENNDIVWDLLQKQFIELQRRLKN